MNRQGCFGCRKTPLGFPTKELQSAARIILALSTKIPHWQPLHRACPLALLFVIFARGGSILRLHLRNIRFDGKLLWPCILLGTSPALMQLTENLVAISFNTSLQTYGGDMAVASVSILSSAMQFVMLLQPGVVQGAQPLLSYNLGAGGYFPCEENLSAAASLAKCRCRRVSGGTDCGHRSCLHHRADVLYLLPKAEMKGGTHRFSNCAEGCAWDLKNVRGRIPYAVGAK